MRPFMLAVTYFNGKFIHHGATEGAEHLDLLVHWETTIGKKMVPSRNGAESLPQAALIIFAYPELPLGKQKKNQSWCALALWYKNVIQYR
jgi:hypothetical protein